MLARQRHDLIVDAVRRDGSVRVRDLAVLLEVSEMTVRRDLDTLAGRGLVDKVHGGAARRSGRSSNEPGFEVKQQQQELEKESISRLAASMVEPGSSVGLTAGTTTWTMAKHLLTIPDLTVVTNAPSVAGVFYGARRANLTVVLTGGVRTPSDALVGPIATASLANLRLDQVFMGVHGMDPVQGYSTPNLAEAELNQAFIRSTSKVVVVADHTKWGVQGMAKIAPLEAASSIITDDRLPDEAKLTLNELDIDYQLVSPKP